MTVSTETLHDHDLAAEMAEALINCETWQDAFPSDSRPWKPLDAICEECFYQCKELWRFEGGIGLDGGPFHVGPLCRVLWLFSPANGRWQDHRLSVDGINRLVQ